MIFTNPMEVVKKIKAHLQTTKGHYLRGFGLIAVRKRSGVACGVTITVEKPGSFMRE